VLPAVAGDLSVASVQLSNGQLNAKPDGTALVIGTPVVVSGPMSIGCGAKVTNEGTVRVVDGGGLTSSCSGTAWQFQNAGTLAFADAAGAQVNATGGWFVNLPGGLVVKSGGASRDSLSGLVEND